MVGAVLLTSSLVRLSRVELGYSAERVLNVPLVISATRYDGFDAFLGFYGDLMPRIRALPGVETAALAHSNPTQAFVKVWFEIPGLIEAPEPDRPLVDLRTVSPGYSGRRKDSG